jgi:carboxymethylenebutenolidase
MFRATVCSVPWLVAAFAFVALALPGVGGEVSTTSDPDYSSAMKREHASDQPVASPAAQAPPAAPVRSQKVTYARLDGKPVEGFLALPDDHKGPYPGILVIHEWWGLNDNIRSMARQLAAEGYAALAVDLYEGEYGDDREAALALMKKSMANRPRVEENLRQAHAYLKDAKDAPKIGTIGWCFGGGWSLGTALLLPQEIDATVIYYGRLVTEKQALAPLQAPILGLFGSEDQGIPVSSVRAFESAMKELGKPASIHVYDGADHAFANPSGTRYDAAAADDAWKRTLAFLAENL